MIRTRWTALLAVALAGVLLVGCGMTTAAPTFTEAKPLAASQDTAAPASQDTAAPASGAPPVALSKDEFIKEADAICSRIMGERGSAAKAFDKALEDASGDLDFDSDTALAELSASGARLVEGLEGLAAAAQQTATEIRALQPPADDRPAIEQLSVGYDELAALIRRTGAGLQSSVTELTSALAEGKDLATKVKALESRLAALGNGDPQAQLAEAEQVMKEAEAMTQEFERVKARFVALEKDSDALAAAWERDFVELEKRRDSSAYGFKTC